MGAHALEAKVEAGLLPAGRIDTWETGVRYQIYHALALLMLGFSWSKINVRSTKVAAWLMVIGTVLFSGSIYLLATRELTGLESLKSFLGPLTPIGGLCLISGWISLLITIIKLPRND